MIPPSLVWLGVIVNLAAGLHYTYCTIQGPDSGGTRPKPNPISWGIWSLSGWLAFLGQITEGVRNEALLTFCVAAVPTFIFVGAIASRRRYGAYAPISRTDIIFGSLAFTALVAWRVTDSGLVAVALSILCDALVAVPVVQQAHRDPTSDSPSIWVAGAANGIITLATIQSFTFLTAGFAIYFVGLCLLVSYLLVVRPRLLAGLIRQPEPASGVRPDTVSDQVAAFAGAFAADYLSWNEADMQMRANTLSSYIGRPVDVQWGWSGHGRQQADLVLTGPVELAPEGYYVVDVRVRTSVHLGDHQVDDAQTPVVLTGASADAEGRAADHCEYELAIPLPSPPRPTAAAVRPIAHTASTEKRWCLLQIPVVVRGSRLVIPT